MGCANLTFNEIWVSHQPLGAQDTVSVMDLGKLADTLHNMDALITGCLFVYNKASIFLTLLTLTLCIVKMLAALLLSALLA